MTTDDLLKIYNECKIDIPEKCVQRQSNCSAFTMWMHTHYCNLAWSLYYSWSRVHSSDCKGILRVLSVSVIAN